jgi:hypothetical protein
MTLGAIACHSQTEVPITEEITHAEDSTTHSAVSIDWCGWGSKTLDIRYDNLLGEAHFRLRNDSPHTVFYVAFDDLQPRPEIEDLWPGASGWHYEEWNTEYRHERLNHVIRLGECLNGLALRELLPGRSLEFSLNIELARFKYFEQIRIRIRVFGGPEGESPMELVSEGVHLDAELEGDI